jgi:hypothetical protein
MEGIEELDINLGMNGFIEWLKTHSWRKKMGPFWRKTGPLAWEQPHGKRGIQMLYLGRFSRSSKDSRQCKIFEHSYRFANLLVFPRSRHVVTLYITGIKSDRVLVLVECRELDVKDTIFAHVVGELYKLRERYAEPEPRASERRAEEAFQRDRNLMPGKSNAGDQDLSPLEDDVALDLVDRKIIKIVNRLLDEGLTATDEEVAAQLPSNPKTGFSYHRVTINRRRCTLRDKGYKV